jgi:hypothetical protein
VLQYILFYLQYFFIGGQGNPTVCMGMGMIVGMVMVVRMAVRMIVTVVVTM